MVIMNKFGIPQQMNPNKMQIQPVNYFDPNKFQQQEQIMPPIMQQPRPIDFQGGPQQWQPQMMPPEIGSYSPPQRMPPQWQPPIRTDFNPSMDFNPMPFDNNNMGAFNGGYPDNQYKKMLLERYYGMGFNPAVQMY